MPLRSWMVLRPSHCVHPDKAAQPPAQLVTMQLSSSVRNHSESRGGAPSAESGILRQSITTGPCFLGRTSCSAPLDQSYSAPDWEAFASMSRPPSPSRPSQVAAVDIKMRPERVADAAATASASSTHHNTDGSALPAGRQGSWRSKRAQLSVIARWRDDWGFNRADADGRRKQLRLFRCHRLGHTRRFMQMAGSACGRAYIAWLR